MLTFCCILVFVPEIDPSLYHPDAAFELDFALTTLSDTYASHVSTYEAYERQAAQVDAILRNSTLGEMVGEIREMVDTSGFVGDFMKATIRRADKNEDPDITEAEYTEAAWAMHDCETTLVNFVQGYSAASLERSRDFFDDLAEAQESAWRGTWRKLHASLSASQGTAMADVAGFFDYLVREQFKDIFNPADRDRGVSSDIDVSVSTFYEVFENHLSRAITRRTEDGWTGL